MKTTRLRVAVRNFPISVFLLFLLAAVSGCSGGYSNGGGGGGGTSPTITGLSPNSGAVGASVTISGNYFGASQGSSTVTFNGTAATPTSWSNTSIVTPVPSGATSGYVVVTVGGVASNGVTFTVSGSGGGGSTAGWTWIQDNPLIFCVQPASTCTISSGEIAATTPGSVWVLQVQTQTNVTMTSVTGGGGTWVHCTSCQVTNPSGFSADAWYNLSGNAGTSSGITFNLSGSSGTVLSANFYELLPPAGYTASFDTAGKATQSSCTTCSGPTLVLAATDAVIMNPGGASAAGWNACSSPYITDANGSCIGLNLPAGSSTPTIKFTGSSNPEFLAIAFKSTLGNFTPPAHQYSVANFTAASQNCTTCTFTIPATGSGHLLFIEAGDESFTHITSVSGGGTWVVPTGANTCQAQLAIAGQSNAASCAYALSSTSGTTSITVTMSGSAATNFAVWEVATNTGTFVLDTQGSVINNSNSFYPNGPALTLSGKNDVIFQLAWVVGGSLGPTFYPLPNIPANGSVGPFNYFLLNQVATAALLDSGPSAPTPVWINPQNTPTFATGIAFKTQ